MFRKIKRYLKDPYFAVGLYLYNNHPHWMSDKFYLQILGRIWMGEKLDLEHPRTMCEKVNWLKLHDRKDLYTILSDKYRAKIWLQEHFGEDFIVPTLMMCEDVDEINFNDLPNAFVIKCNHDSGNVFMCYNKSSNIFYDKHMVEHNWEEVRYLLTEGLKENYYWKLREWPYKNIKPCIMVEELLRQKDGSSPNDYKLFFINGEFQFTYVSFDREGVNDRCTYDEKWQHLPFVYADHFNENINTSEVSCPASYQQMLEFGRKIAQNYKFVRIDMYDVDGKMYFGEVTSYHTGGFAEFYPPEYDAIYATKLKLE